MKKMTMHIITLGFIMNTVSAKGEMCMADDSVMRDFFTSSCAPLDAQSSPEQGFWQHVPGVGFWMCTALFGFVVGNVMANHNQRKKQKMHTIKSNNASQKESIQSKVTKLLSKNALKMPLSFDISNGNMVYTNSRGFTVSFPICPPLTSQDVIDMNCDLNQRYQNWQNLMQTFREQHFSDDATEEKRDNIKKIFMTAKGQYIFSFDDIIARVLDAFHHREVCDEKQRQANKPLWKKVRDFMKDFRWQDCLPVKKKR